MKNLTHTFAANISYGGLTYNTPLIVEYKHTGTQFIVNGNKGRRILSDRESALKYLKKKKKVFYSDGYYFISRLAIPTINAKGEKDIWYINNEGDNYMLNKVSKYAKKIHSQLSEEKLIPFKN